MIYHKARAFSPGFMFYGSQLNQKSIFVNRPTPLALADTVINEKSIKHRVIPDTSLLPLPISLKTNQKKCGKYQSRLLLLPALLLYRQLLKYAFEFFY